MKKIITLLMLSLLIIAMPVLSACGEKPSGDSSSVENGTSSAEEYKSVDMTVACMTGPTGVGMAKLMADSDDKATANNYSFTVASAATEINPGFIKGEIKIASVPTNVAAALYNQTGGKVRMLAVNTYGVLSILEKGDSIKSVADLKGKKIYSTGKGQNPEYILKYILEKNGINPDTDVTIEFVSSDALKAHLISGEAEVALAPEPLATAVLSKNTELKRALSINDEWSKVSDTTLMMGCVIALDSYVTENKAAVEKFLEEYKASIEFAAGNVDEAAKYCATYKIADSEAIAKKAIPNCNLCYVTGAEMKTNVNGYFGVLFAADPKSIGGALPADDLFYNAN